jgi:hypothetical protein
MEHKHFLPPARLLTVVHVNITYKNCGYSSPEDEPMRLEICRRLQKLKKIELKYKLKVCISLVYVA